MKVLVVIGTRPEVIKLAPVIRELRRRAADGADVQVRVCATAQHREVLDQALRDLSLSVDEDLGIMRPGQTPTRVASEVLARLEPILDRERPDWVIVQGDTTSAVAGALAAFYAGCRVGHVEAGLRTGRVREPFPEEMNRRWVSCVADLHFAPSARARDALLGEGIPSDHVVVSGNPGMDSLLWALAQPCDLRESDLGEDTLPGACRLLLVTAHRRESFGLPLEDIGRGIRLLAERHAANVRVVLPVHPNPRVREPLERLLDGVPGVLLREPLSYTTTVQLLRRAFCVLTDSGGVQEEASFLGTPALVLRDVTDRPEVVEAGASRLVGTRAATIVGEVEALLQDPARHAAMARPCRPFGNGDAAPIIVEALREGMSAGRGAQPLPGIEVAEG